MGSGFTIFSSLALGFSVAVVLLAVHINNGGFWRPKTVPNLPEEWWGPGKPTKTDTTIRPFKISVPDSVIEDLNRRLENTREPTEALEGTHFEYGFNSLTLAKVLKFWRTEYKWQERQAFLNQYPQFKTTIQGLDIHFLHVKPSSSLKAVHTVPLLLLHGWPGSIREFYSLISLLSAHKDVAFNIVAPSLPGYGFSQGAARRGLGTAQMAVIFRNLMLRLGYDSFYVQGGDWGSLIGANMAVLYPENVRGYHSNFCFVQSPVTMVKTILGSFWPSLIVDANHQHKMYPMKKIFFNLLEESGYMHIQATKPDTIGVALNDSPAGLAAYIMEKFSTWTNPKWKTMPDGGLTTKYKYTDLLDNIMIYWVTGSITTSVRLYAENFSKAQRRLLLDYMPVTVPTACAKFPHELMYQPDSLLKDRYNLVQSTEYDDGGHFAAMEVPEIMANDISTFIRKMEAKRQ